MFPALIPPHSYFREFQNSRIPAQNSQFFQDCGISCATISPGLDPGISPGLDPGISPGLDPGISPFPSPGLDPGISPSLDPGISPFPSPGLNPGISPGLDPGISPGLDPGISPGLDPGISPGLDPGISPGLDPGISPFPSPGLDPGISPGLGADLFRIKIPAGLEFSISKETAGKAADRGETAGISALPGYQRNPGGIPSSERRQKIIWKLMGKRIVEFWNPGGIPSSD
uniref:Uncharacterized protein n=1 Tax=Taeniopygia guttata TaxID=59729 RepID=A0A674HU04_TAEGU